MMNEPWKIVDFPVHRHKPEVHKPGMLVLAQDFGNITGLFYSCPRVYWIINDTDKTVERGGHYHPAEGKKEILICISGTAVVSLHSPTMCGHVDLDRPDRGVIINEKTWHKVFLEPGAILLALASTVQMSGEAIDQLPCGRH